MMKLLNILLLLLITTCSPFENEQFVPVDYTGEWHWVSSTGGIMGEVIQSDSVNYTQSLDINQSNEARWFRDGELVQKFKISKLSSDEDGELLLKPDTNEDENSSPIDKVILGYQDGYLTVYDRCYDCYNHRFTR
ncbi:MAG: hypothetical protein WD511_00270 [Balneolaceae bacterium]